MGLGGDRRGASELVGTVFVIALTIAVAVMILALAGGAIQAIGDETEDSLTNDAFYQMNGQIDQLATSQIDAATELGFPEDASVEPMPQEGNVTVNVSVTDPTHASHVLADEPYNSTNFTVGSLIYEDRHGQTLLYQGGGLWQYSSQDHVTLRSSPPFDYDGERITFQFVNISSITTVNEGEKLTVSKSAEQSKSYSKQIRNELSAQWTIDEGSGFTVPVDVNVTIESKFAPAWKVYAEEGMRQQPDDIVYYSNENDPDKQANVTLVFEGIGGSDLPEYPGPILYAGSAAQASNMYDPFGNGTIEEGPDEHDFTIRHNSGPHRQQQQLAFYDRTRDEWVIHWDKNNNNPPHNNNAWYNVSESVTGLGEPVYSDDTVPPQIDAFVSDAGDETYTYEIADSYAGMPVCVVAYDGDNIGPGNDHGVVENLEQCALNLDVEDPGDYMPTNLEVNISTNVTEGVLGESKDLEVEVENVGAVSSQVGHDVALYHEIDDELVLADYATSSSIGTIDPGDSKTIDMSWTPRDTDTDAIHAVVGSHDADRRNVTVEGRNIDLDVEVSDETPDTVAYGERLTVNASINNTGNVGLSDTNVVLREEDGSPVDRTQISLEPGNETNVSLDWRAPLADFDERLEVQVIGSNDTHRVSPSGRANFEVGIEWVGDPARNGLPMNVSATVENTGNANGTQEILLIADGEQVDSLIADSAEVGPLPPGETTQVYLTWDSPVDPVSGDNNVSVRTRDAVATESFDVAPRYDVTINEVTPDNVSEGDLSRTVAVEATITNRGDVEGSQEISLEVPESSDLSLSNPDSVHKSISGGESESVTLQGTIESDALTGNLSVSSADETANSRVIVERDGPDCSAVRPFDGSGTTSDPYRIGTVDELQCINEHVYNDLDHDAHYVLTDDIDAHGTRHWNSGAGFMPIGPEGNDYSPTNYDYGTTDHAFSGHFDGQGHEIEGLYIRRPSDEFVGLFGATSYTTNHGGPPGVGSTVTNVKLSDVDIHGKRHVGGLIGQAGGTVIQSRSQGIVRAEQQLVGGLVGDGAHGELDNELVAEGTVIGGENPNGLNGEGVGGLVGRSSYQTQVSVGYTRNMTVRAVGTGTDGDLYDSSHAGGLIGTSSYRDSVFEQMYTDTNAEGFDDHVGSIVGTILGDEDESTVGDRFTDSVYWNLDNGDSNGYGVEATDPGAPSPTLNQIGLSSDAMKGPAVLPDSEARNHAGVTREDTRGTMANLNWSIWAPVYDIDRRGNIVNESYPIFAWEVEGAFVVEDIDAPQSVTEGDTVIVDVTITNTKDELDTQSIRLFDPEGNPLAVTDRRLGPGDTATVTFEWNTRIGDNTTHLDESKITVRTDDTGNTQALDILPQESPKFTITDLTAPDEANATEQVNVSTHVVNRGGSGNQTLFLEHEDGRVLDSLTVDLDKEERADVNLSWFSNIDDDGDDQTLTVKTRNDEESTMIDMDEASVSNFTIGNVTFPDFEDDETPVVTAGDSITANVTIENEGGAPSTELVWMTPAGAPEILDHNETRLDAGEAVTFNLTWNATSPEVDVLEIHVEGEDPITKPIHVQHSLDGVVADPIDVDLTLINRAD